MSQSQPVTRIVNVLSKAGYSERPSPITVGSVPFEFAAILLGSKHTNDLIVVADTLVDSEARIKQKVDGLSRALDLVLSRRPLTTVLVGPAPKSSVIESIARVSRVLLVGTPTGKNADAFISDVLAVLLPLTLPDAADNIVNWPSEVRDQLSTPLEESSVEAYFAAAYIGVDAVKETLGLQLDTPFSSSSEPFAT